MLFRIKSSTASRILVTARKPIKPPSHSTTSTSLLMTAFRARPVSPNTTTYGLCLSNIQCLYHDIIDALIDHISDVRGSQIFRILFIIQLFPSHVPCDSANLISHVFQDRLQSTVHPKIDKPSRGHQPPHKSWHPGSLGC